MDAETLATLNQLLEEFARWDSNDSDRLGGLRWQLEDVRQGLGEGSKLAELAEKTLQGIDLLEAAAPENRAVPAAVVIEALKVLAGAVSEDREDGPDVQASMINLSQLVSAVPAEDEFQLLPDDADRDLLGEFITESLELIQQAEAALLTLETDPSDAEAVNTVFRAFHTIKGTSAFLGIAPVQSLAHKAETLLAMVRDKKIRYGGLFADLALRSSDLIKDLMYSLTAAMSGERIQKPAGYDQLVATLSDPKKLAEEEAGEEKDDLTSLPHVRMGDILVADGKVSPEVIQAVANVRGEDRLGVAMVKAGVVSASDVADALRKQRKLDKLRTSAVDASVRVRTDRLDKLIEMVGELVIAQSMVEQDETVKSGRHYDLARKTSHMGKIVRELQDLSMSMRMVPLKSTFQKMNRLVRDVSQKVGKEVEFTCEGEETEIDRNMVDAINDPLVHMLRNCVDHGLERPEERAAAGKDRQGKVHLAAFHSGGQVVVSISDDGRGLDREKIARKAIQKGVIDTDKGMSDEDVYNLLFEPGFSTAEKVTDISGRGVGLDVVRRNIEGMRGRIEIRTQQGKGTTFMVFLPLTLAITDGMLIKVGTERYILPTANIAKAFRPAKAELSSVVQQGEMVEFQGGHIPLFRLGRLFQLEGGIDDPTSGLLIVVSDGGGHYALLADEIIGQQQIVAKSLGDAVQKVPGVSGGAILGDGRVGLILDPQGIGALARRTGGEESLAGLVGDSAA